MFTDNLFWFNPKKLFGFRTLIYRPIIPFGETMMNGGVGANGQWVWAWVPSSLPMPMPPMGPIVSPMQPFMDPMAAGIAFPVSTPGAGFEEVLVEESASEPDVKEPTDVKKNSSSPNLKDPVNTDGSKAPILKDANSSNPEGSKAGEKSTTKMEEPKVIQGKKRSSTEAFAIPTAKNKPLPPQHVPPRHLILAAQTKPDSSSGWESQSWGNWHSRSWDYDQHDDDGWKPKCDSGEWNNWQKDQ